MKKFLFLPLLSLFVSSFALAATPPDFDLTRWYALVKKMSTEGSRTDNTQGTMYTLARVVPADITQTHSADYMSVFGQYVENIFAPAEKVFVPSEIHSVTEQWTLRADGSWEINQWIRTASLDGELTKVVHVRIVKKGSTVLEYARLPVGSENSPEELASWGQKIGEWY